MSLKPTNLAVPILFRNMLTFVPHHLCEALRLYIVCDFGSFALESQNLCAGQIPWLVGGAAREPPELGSPFLHNCYILLAP